MNRVYPIIAGSAGFVRGLLSVIADCLNRAHRHRLIAGRVFGFVFRLFADIRVPMLERAGEVIGRGVATDVAVDARAVNVEAARHVLFHAVVWIRHYPQITQDYAD